MGNPWAGEVVLRVGGQARVCKLTLGALAELEAALAAGSLIELVERFETGRFAARDVLAVLLAGLRGGGWAGSAADLAATDIGGGPIGAAQVAAQLLARAFTVPDDGQPDGGAAWPASTGPG